MTRYSTPEKRARHAEEQRRYRAAHREAHLETVQRWRKQNLQRRRDSQNDWRKRNLTRVHSKTNEWYRTEKGRHLRLKSNAKRRSLRPISFTLNRKFGGAQLHHVEQSIGIWLPFSVHRKIKHNLLTGEGMVKINEIAAEWVDNGGERQQ